MRIALSLHKTAEVLTWETDVTLRVGKKIFVIGGDGSSHESIKASLESESDRVYRDPESVARYATEGRVAPTHHYQPDEGQDAAG